MLIRTAHSFSYSWDPITNLLYVAVHPFWRLSYLLGLGVAAALFGSFAGVLCFTLIREVIRASSRSAMLPAVFFSSLLGGLAICIAFTIVAQLIQTTTIEIDRVCIRVEKRGLLRTRRFESALSESPSFRLGPLRAVLKPHFGGRVLHAATGLVLSAGDRSFWLAKQLQGDAVFELADCIFRHVPEVRALEDTVFQDWLAYRTEHESKGDSGSRAHGDKSG
jgi:hypothetical protein